MAKRRQKSRKSSRKSIRKMGQEVAQQGLRPEVALVGLVEAGVEDPMGVLEELCGIRLDSAPYDGPIQRPISLEALEKRGVRPDGAMMDPITAYVVVQGWLYGIWRDNRYEHCVLDRDHLACAKKAHDLIVEEVGWKRFCGSPCMKSFLEMIKAEGGETLSAAVDDILIGYADAPAVPVPLSVAYAIAPNHGDAMIGFQDMAWFAKNLLGVSSMDFARLLSLYSGEDVDSHMTVRELPRVARTVLHDLIHPVIPAIFDLEEPTDADREALRKASFDEEGRPYPWSFAGRASAIVRRARETGDDGYPTDSALALRRKMAEWEMPYPVPEALAWGNTGAPGGRRGLAIHDNSATSPTMGELLDICAGTHLPFGSDALGVLWLSAPATVRSSAQLLSDAVVGHVAGVLAAHPGPGERDAAEDLVVSEGGWAQTLLDADLIDADDVEPLSTQMTQAMEEMAKALKRRLESAEEISERRHGEKEQKLEGKLEELKGRLEGAMEELEHVRGELASVKEAHAASREAQESASREVADAKAEAQALRDEVAGLKGELHSARERLRDVLATKPVFELEEVPEVKSVPEALEAAQEAWKDRLTILPSAFDSAETCAGSVDAAEMLEILHAMAEHLWPLHFIEGSKTIESDFRNRSGFRLSKGESSIVKKTSRLSDARYFEYQGSDVLMESHVKGRNDNARRCIRVHYAFDEELETIVIGHAGGHLPLVKRVS